MSIAEAKVAMKPTAPTLMRNQVVVVTPRPRRRLLDPPPIATVTRVMSFTTSVSYRMRSRSRSLSAIGHGLYQKAVRERICFGPVVGAPLPCYCLAGGAPSGGHHAASDFVATGAPPFSLNGKASNNTPRDGQNSRSN